MEFYLIKFLYLVKGSSTSLPLSEVLLGNALASVILSVSDRILQDPSEPSQSKA